MPERRLQRHLQLACPGVRVFTIGTNGYGQDQQLLALQEYFGRFRASMVVVWQTPQNDVWNNLFPTHWPTDGAPKPTFWLNDGALDGPTCRPGEPTGPGISGLPGLWRRFVKPRPDWSWEATLPPPYRPATSAHAPLLSDWQERWTRIPDMRHENLRNDKNHFAIGFTPPSPRTEYGVQLTARLMQRMRQVSAQNGASVVAFMTDVLAQHGEGVFERHGEYFAYSEAQVWEHMRVINRGLPTYRLRVREPQWRAGPWDSHLNEHAVDAVMKDFADQLGPTLGCSEGRMPSRSDPNKSS